MPKRSLVPAKRLRIDTGGRHVKTTLDTQLVDGRFFEVQTIDGTVVTEPSPTLPRQSKKAAPLFDAHTTSQ